MDPSVGFWSSRNILLTSQVAVCLMLLAGAGMLFRGAWRLQQVDTQFDSPHILWLGISTQALASTESRANSSHPPGRGSHRGTARGRFGRPGGPCTVSRPWIGPIRERRTSNGVLPVRRCLGPLFRNAGHSAVGWAHIYSGRDGARGAGRHRERVGGPRILARAGSSGTTSLRERVARASAGSKAIYRNRRSENCAKYLFIEGGRSVYLFPQGHCCREPAIGPY